METKTDERQTQVDTHTPGREDQQTTGDSSGHAIIRHRNTSPCTLLSFVRPSIFIEGRDRNNVAREEKEMSTRFESWKLKSRKEKIGCVVKKLARVFVSFFFFVSFSLFFLLFWPYYPHGGIALVFTSGFFRHLVCPLSYRPLRSGPPSQPSIHKMHRTEYICDCLVVSLTL
jgi:hypothetical protein